MKRIIYLLTILFTFVIASNYSYAADVPVYDPTYNNNEGAFYANGINIEITKDENSNTVIKWDGGRQIVQPTVTIYGGGKNGTSYDSSNITMQDGTVLNLVAGGVSTDESKPAIVANANITLNGGTVTGNIVGGGYVYSEVENSNLTVNDGNVGVITGGGFASVVVNGVYYNVGTEENPEDSPNRTERTNIVINDGTVKYPDSDLGLLFGGGQGYSYVGNSKIIVNDGDLSKAYVTAGGSNGYTGNSNVEINGGEIETYQSVNRGIVDAATLTMSGGKIESLYVGGETDDATVTGTINNSTVNLLNGIILNLEEGKSNSQPLIIDNKNYSAVKTKAVNIENDKIKSGEVEITFDLNLDKNSLTVFEEQSQKVNASVETTPKGYENLFLNKIVWETEDEDIATVQQDGVITGKSVGNTTITATLFDKIQTVNVNVEENNICLLVIWLVVPLLLIIILIVLFFLIDSFI